MPVADSKDLRTRVIAAWEAKQESQRQLAERFKVSLSYVQRVLRCYRQTGQIEALPTWSNFTAEDFVRASGCGAKPR